jgi:two-component system LytT family response regulator
LAISSRDAQLNNLSAQLNPHFLFNSLNNIKSLVIDDPKSARRAIDLLSDLLRNGLYQNNGQLSTIKNEMELVKDYLELERLRIEDRLQQEIHVDEALSGITIPLFNIQTLVENALKHGIAQQQDGGIIRIDITAKEGFVQITVENPGTLNSERLTTGIGLKNLQERMQLQYQGKAKFCNCTTTQRNGFSHHIDPAIMIKIRVVIIDDERAARDELKRLLENYPDFEVAGEARNADEAKAQIENLHPDLIFLDIQMPGKSGFDLLESLEKVPQVIFVTAFDHYAVKAFEVSALDYLMKPVRDERFEKAITQARAKLATHKDEQIFVKDRQQYHFITWRDVYLIESMDNYARLYFKDKNVFLKSSLNELEKKLNADTFLRINRAQIINMDFVDKISAMENGQVKLTLKTGWRIRSLGKAVGKN